MLQDQGSGAAEAVSSGHPDKFMDRVADTVLDRALALDPMARVAVDGVVKNRLVTLGMEVTCPGNLGVRGLIEDLFRETYGQELEGVVFHSSRQSEDIALGVDASTSVRRRTGAGDQGIMFGYATAATPSRLPLQLHRSWELLNALEALRNIHGLPWLRSDAKSQVVILEGDVVDVTISTSHAEDVTLDELREQVLQRVIIPVMPWLGERVATRTDCGFEVNPLGTLPTMKVNINPTGRFVAHGPFADAGEVGRKIVVDQYGDACPVGGGAFSGKDPTKVDRTAAYYARHVAVSLVNAGLCTQAGVKVAYTIGLPDPRILQVYTDASGNRPDARLTALVRDRFDFTPDAMIEQLGLRTPVGWTYANAARGPFWPGHGNFPWNRPAELTGAQV